MPSVSGLPEARTKTRAPAAPRESAGRHGVTAFAAADGAMREYTRLASGTRLNVARAASISAPSSGISGNGCAIRISRWRDRVSAHRRQDRARVGCLPVRRHPRAHQIAIERAGAAEHQIDAHRLVQEIRPAQIAVHLGFQPPDQARQQHPLERVPVDAARAGRQLGVLRQAEGRPPPAPRAVIVSVRQRAGLVEQRQDARQVGIGDRVELQARRGPLVVGERRRHLVEPGLVLAAGLQQQRAAEQQHQRYRREGAAAHEHSAPRGAGPLGDQHRLAEDHVLDQPATGNSCGPDRAADSGRAAGPCRRCAPAPRSGDRSGSPSCVPEVK